MVLQSFFREGSLGASVLGVDSLYAVLGLVVGMPVVLGLLYTTLVTKKTPAGTRRVLRPKSTLPLLENTIDFVRKVPVIHEWLKEECLLAQGEPFLLRSFGRPDMTVLSTVEGVEEVLKLQFDNFPKGSFFNDNMRDILGHGIFAVDHGKWVHQRKTASNLFSARTLRESMARTVRKHTQTVCQILDNVAAGREPIDLFKLFNRFTIESFSELGFGIHLNCLEAKEEHPFQTAFDSAQRVVAMRFLRPGWFWRLQRFLNVGLEAQLKKDIKIIDDTVLGIINESLARRARNERRDDADIVSLFLDNYEASSDNDGKAFDPVYLRDIVVNFLIAGRDTTAQALSWFFLMISEHPEVVTKIRNEIATTLPDLNGPPTMEQIQQLTYLEAALKETLRLYPSVPFQTKHVAEDIVLSDGTFLGKNTTVAMSCYGMARLPHVWGPDAAEFKPERWIDPDTGKIIAVSQYKFFSFNAGPRLCLGMNLAMMEMKIIVTSILSQFNVQVMPEQKVTYDFSVTLPVKGAMMARVTKV